MRVLLVSTNQLATPYPVYPIGLDYVAGAISPPHEVRVVDLFGRDGNEIIDRELGRFSPEMVGLSIRNIDTVEINNSLNLVSGLERIVQTIHAAGDAKVVLGGSGFTIMPDRILALTGADYGVVGEGERLTLLIDALESGKDVVNIPGIVTPNPDQSDNGALSRGFHPPPWSGPIIRRSPIDPEAAEPYLAQGGMLNLQTKRGCPYQCVYCTYPVVEGRVVRPFNPRETAGEALRLQEAGARYFYVVDSVLNSDVDHSLSVARHMKRAGVTIAWGAYFSPRPVPGDYYDRLAESGLTHVEFGTDSLSPATLSSCCKPFTVEDVFASHRAAREAGLHVAHYLLLGGPGENPDTVDETLSNAELMEGAVIFVFEGMRIYPHTPLYRQAVAEGQVTPTEALIEPRYYLNQQISPAEITRTVAARAKGRLKWVIGSGGDRMHALISLMHRRGADGPLWERLAG